MSSIAEFISALAPAYANDARIGIFTNLATAQTSRTRFRDKYEYAVALRVCHLIARNPEAGTGTTGAVTSKSEGEISESYHVSSDLLRRYGDLCSTPFGAQLAQLIEGNVLAVTTSRMGRFLR